MKNGWALAAAVLIGLIGLLNLGVGIWNANTGHIGWALANFAAMGLDAAVATLIVV